jgi:oligoendopeptidase F
MKNPHHEIPECRRSGMTTHECPGVPMHPAIRYGIPALSLFFSAAEPAAAQPRERSSIPQQHTWDLTPLYSTADVWRAAKDKLKAALPAVETYQGKLGSSASQMLACLNIVTELTKEFSRLHSYASMNLDEDTRVSGYQAMQQEMSQIGADLGARSAFIEPEILKLDTAVITRFLTAEPKLQLYRHYLDDIQRRRPHTGTEGEERIIADAGLMADGAENIYSTFSNAEFPYPVVALSDGKRVLLDQSAYALYRTLPNREDRKKVFEAFFGRMNDYRRTYGTQLNAEVRKNLFFTRARKYESPLHHALDANNIPVQVYHSLVDNVSRNLGTFHRYLKLRKRILGVSELHYYDLYAPLLKDVDLQYSYDDAKRIVQDAMGPLGPEYTSVIQRAFSDRWVDVYPTEAKRSGAYSNGSAYDVHPYILLNYNGKFDDVSTLAHELGHTMHSYHSNAKQPYATSQYAIFVAEVASTFNEALLMDHMLKTITDDQARLSLLGNYLENIKGTVFRQTQFAEFELRIHEKVQNGEALTGDSVNELYDQITRRYYGHDQGICIVDEMMKAEWMYISHFYYNFYVYQYATAFTASAALSEQVLAGDTQTRARYLSFLGSGGSDYPIALLKNAGVDMTTSRPFDLTMQKMNRVMDEMEKILDSMGKK